NASGSSERVQTYRPAERGQSAIGGNESFLDIRTHPSHNKRVNPAQFVRSKSAHHVESKGDRVRSSFKSFAINIGLIRLASADLGAGLLQVADFAGLLSP